jgi:hypothetical protein
VEHREHLLELFCYAVCVLARRDARLFGYALYVDAVLVRAREEYGLKPALPFVAR